VNVERALTLIDAVDRTLLDAGLVLDVNTWLGNHVRHVLLLVPIVRGGNRSAVERALGDARALLRPGEQLPAAVPALLPKTRAAVSAYAEACGAEVRDEIRRLLFSAYWEGGVDIGNPLVLHTLLAGAFMRGTLPRTRSVSLGMRSP
jgi:hypothetical protein